MSESVANPRATVLVRKAVPYAFVFAMAITAPGLTSGAGKAPEAASVSAVPNQSKRALAKSTSAITLSMANASDAGRGYTLDIRQPIADTATTTDARRLESPISFAIEAEVPPLVEMREVARPDNLGQFEDNTVSLKAPKILEGRIPDLSALPGQNMIEARELPEALALVPGPTPGNPLPDNRGPAFVADLRSDALEVNVQVAKVSLEDTLSRTSQITPDFDLIGERPVSFAQAALIPADIALAPVAVINLSLTSAPEGNAGAILEQDAQSRIAAISEPGSIAASPMRPERAQEPGPSEPIDRPLVAALAPVQPSLKQTKSAAANTVAPIVEAPASAPSPPAGARRFIATPTAKVEAPRAAEAIAAKSALVPNAKVQPDSKSARAGFEFAIKSRIAARINGKISGELEFQQTTESLKVRLGSIIDMLKESDELGDLTRYANSPVMDMFLPLPKLREAGIPISYDPVYDEFNIGSNDYRPKAAHKVQIDQLSVPERSSAIGIDQIFNQTGIKR